MEMMNRKVMLSYLASALFFLSGVIQLWVGRLRPAGGYAPGAMMLACSLLWLAVATKFRQRASQQQGKK